MKLGCVVEILGDDVVAVVRAKQPNFLPLVGFTSAKTIKGLDIQIYKGSLHKSSATSRMIAVHIFFVDEYFNSR